MKEMVRLQELYSIYSDSLYKYAYKKNNNTAIAGDAVCHSFFLLYVELTKGNMPAYVATFLIKQVDTFLQHAESKEQKTHENDSCNHGILQIQ